MPLPRYGRIHSLPRSRRIRPKHRERNIAAAILGMVVIATLATALAEPRWFYLHGGTCDHEYIGLYMFFNVGAESDPGLSICVTDQAVELMRVIISFVFLGIALSLVAFVLDTFGPISRALKIIRRHAIGNILTVLLCVTVNGFCYWISVLIENQLEEHKRGSGSSVEVKFDVGFYLIAGAGGLSVIVVATNMLKRYPTYDDSGDDGSDDWDNEFFNMPPTFSPAVPSSQVVPAPPAYAP
ncbi:transmembrane protein 127-like [Ptychodera flava]|uniref:transmembrane protein 127-like n=1 Tax=Ptychodera flava TaxID=63121 RepID=UPI00396A8727